ncbi:MAG: hypothetical protein ACIALR_04235 [Blastopirellula sp. JB062]
MIATNGDAVTIQQVEARVRCGRDGQTFTVLLGRETYCPCSEFRKSGARRTCRHVEAVRNFGVTPKPPQEQRTLTTTKETTE